MKKNIQLLLKDKLYGILFWKIINLKLKSNNVMISD